jgi:hypothetical protein
MGHDGSRQAIQRRRPVSERVDRHRTAEAELDGLSDEDLVGRLSRLGLSDQGGAAMTLPESEVEVFVKLSPVTALELEPRHRHSTANFFGLPSYYQYRLGSCGFGVWRELAVHRLANEWVLTGQCPQFPLLHSWRTLPIVSRGEDDKMSLAPWGDDSAICGRVTAIRAATSSVALFLECLPQTLGQWLAERLRGSLDPAALVAETEAALLSLLAFVEREGLLHLDAHFENVLTDGSQIFLADFGLTTSRAFRLDQDELAFFERHENFDRCTAITSLVHAIVSRYDSRADWRLALRELSAGTHTRTGELAVGIRAYLARRGPLALAIGEFYEQLRADLAADYPAERLQRILDDASVT